jgi:imidazolonepropionase-like amidohydrolase
VNRCVLVLVAGLAILALASCRESSSDGVAGQVTAFVHVNLVPMTGEVILEDHAVLVQGSRIIAIGPTAQVPVPKYAAVIDGVGAYVMPGLADMHVHSTGDWVAGHDWPVSPLRLYLANGVTTVRDCGHTGDISLPLRWRDEIDTGNLDGPTIYTTGSVFHGDHRGRIYQGVVQEQLDQGYDFIKLRDVRSADQFFLVADEVDRAGVYMASHVPFRVGLDSALSAGLDEIAHVEELYFEILEIDTHGAQVDEDWIVRIVNAMFQLYGTPPGSFDADEVERLVKELHGASIATTVDRVRSAGVPVGTTMVVNNPQVEFDPAAFLGHPANRYLSRSILDMVRKGETKIQRALEDIGPEYQYLASVKYAADKLALKTLRGAGVPVLLGTDSGSYLPIIPGFSVHVELRILTENGFTPYEAIAAATANAARVVEAMTGEADMGTIEVGKRADLILIGGNPLEDVSSISDPLGVMASGRWYPKEVLGQMIALEG